MIDSIDQLDKKTVYFDIHSARDDLGRYSFGILWWDENFHSGPGWRGQEFFADTTSYEVSFHAMKRKILMDRDLISWSVYAELKERSHKVEMERRKAK